MHYCKIENEEMTDTYDESYLFFYSSKNQLEKIQGEARTVNILETLPAAAEEHSKVLATHWSIINVRNKKILLKTSERKIEQDY